MYNHSLNKLQALQYGDHSYDPLLSASSFMILISPRNPKASDVKKNKFQLRRESMADQAKKQHATRKLSPPEMSDDQAYQRFLSQLSGNNRTVNSI